MYKKHIYFVHDITEILLKVGLSIITPAHYPIFKKKKICSATSDDDDLTDDQQFIVKYCDCRCCGTFVTVDCMYRRRNSVLQV